MTMQLPAQRHGVLVDAACGIVERFGVECVGERLGADRGERLAIGGRRMAHPPSVVSGPSRMFRRGTQPFDVMARRRNLTPVRVEFTIEPFVEGQPGSHVLAALAAAEALGVAVEFGPFGSSFEVDTGRVGATVSAVIDAALDNGATHVTVDVSPGASGDG